MDSAANLQFADLKCQPVFGRIGVLGDRGADFLVGSGQVAVAVAIDVERVAVIHHPDPVDCGRAKRQQQIFWRALVNRFFFQCAVDFRQIRGGGCANGNERGQANE